MHPVYRILMDKAVKRGPFATIWHARDEVLDRQVAVKELRNWNSRPIRARASYRFAHVRRLSLNHPGLAPVYGEDPDRGWLTLEFFPEGSLADRLHREGGPMAVDAVRSGLVEMLEALAFLHEKGWIHGAVKPKNLFLSARGKLVLADGLGLRQDGDGPSQARELFASLEAEEGKYLPPECLDGKADRIGPATDLYALGLTILEQLLGGAWFVMLFPKVQLRAQRWEDWQLSAEVLPSLGELLPEAPVDLVAVVDGLLRKTPDDRIGAARALTILCPPPPPTPAPAPSPPAKALQAITKVAPPASAAPVALAAPAAPLPLPPVPQSGRTWTVGVCLGALGVGMLTAVFVWPGLSRERAGATATLEKEFRATRNHLTHTSAELGDQKMHVASLERQLQEAQIRLAKTKTTPPPATATDDKAYAFMEKALGEVRANLNQARTSLNAEKARADSLDKDLKETQIKLAQTESARSDAGSLAKELESARTALARTHADLKEFDLVRAALIQARADLADQKVRADRLAQELKDALEASGKQNKRAHELEDRLKRATFVALTKLGAKIEADPKRPDHPVLKVDLSNTKATDDDLALLAGFTSLETLSLAGTQVSDAGLSRLKGFARLHTLDLLNTPVSDTGLIYLEKLTRLQTLSLAGTQVSDAGLARLKGFAGLQTLDLFRTRVGDAGLVHLEKLKNLQNLILSTTEVSDAGLNRLVGLGKLRSLDLSFTRVTDAGLDWLEDLNLETLVLSSTRVSDSGLYHLKRLPKLQTLSLASTQVSDAGLQELKQLSGLRTLDLSFTTVGDAGLGQLTKLGQLNRLYLASTRVSDAGTNSLKEFASLQCLDLSFTQVSDASVAFLKGLTSLKELYLAHSRVTAASKEELRQALPGCTFRR